MGVTSVAGFGSTRSNLIPHPFPKPCSSFSQRQTRSRALMERLVWVFASDIEVPDPLPLAFFPTPCPYREAALRALASTQRAWHIACTSSSLAGVRAIAMGGIAGIAVTPLPVPAITAGLRILGKRDKLPSLPKVDYVLESNPADTRPVLAAFSEHCQRSLSGRGQL
jgi:DNA-binding transcriptional LysR family regulator